MSFPAITLFTFPPTSRRLFAAIILVVLAVAGCRSGLETGRTVDDQRYDPVIEQLLKHSTDDQGDDGDGSSPNPSGGETPRLPSNGEVAFQTVHDQADKESDTFSFSNDSKSQAIAQVSFDKVGQQTYTLALEDALRLAIENSEFITDPAGFLSPANRLLEDPQFLQSKYDLDMQKSSQQSVDAALSEFDIQIATGFQWGRNSIILANSNLLASDLLVNDNGNFYGRLDKPILSGGTVSLIHNLNYAGGPQSFTLDPRFTGFLRGEFRQPLLAGRGRTQTEIAGPNSYRNRQQRNGIALAEITERTAELEFELGVQRLLKQTEELYWDYWLASQVYENQQTARENADEIWSRIRNRAEAGLTGGGAADEAQAEENFYRRKSLADSALIDLQQSAERLQHVTGLNFEQDVVLIASTDPMDVPTVFDIESSKANGLNNRIELVKQDLQVKAIELQLLAAKQLNRPQLDLVSGVQFNGLGDQLFGSENGALPDFVDTDDVGWNAGFEFSMPVGFNRERLNIRYLRLLLTKSRTARKLQEKEILHEISYSAKSVDKWRGSLSSAKKRLAAANRRLAAVEADFKSSRAPLDLLLRSQDSVAESKTEVSRAVAELTKAQLDFLFRQGVR